MEEDWEGIGYTFEQAFTLNYFVQPFWTQCEADNDVTYMYTRQSEEGTKRTSTQGIKVKQECLSPGVVVAMSISPPGHKEPPGVPLVVSSRRAALYPSVKRQTFHCC
jgi:hypothetical protein